MESFCEYVRRTTPLFFDDRCTQVSDDRRRQVANQRRRPAAAMVVVVDSSELVDFRVNPWFNLGVLFV